MSLSGKTKRSPLWVPNGKLTMLLDVTNSWSLLSSRAAVISKPMPSHTVVQVSQWEPKLLKISRSRLKKKKALAEIALRKVSTAHLQSHWGGGAIVFFFGHPICKAP